MLARDQSRVPPGRSMRFTSSPVNGAYFARHPEVQPATLTVADAAHPATAGLPDPWRLTDEWYDFRALPGPGVRVLLRLDERSYTGGGMGADHPIAWCHDVGAGRAFYTGVGHTDRAYGDPAVRAHLAGGARWAARLE